MKFIAQKSSLSLICGNFVANPAGLYLYNHTQIPPFSLCCGHLWLISVAPTDSYNILHLSMEHQVTPLLWNAYAQLHHR